MSLIGFKNEGGRQGSLESVLLAIHNAAVKVTSCVVTEYTPEDTIYEKLYASKAVIYFDPENVRNATLAKLNNDFEGQLNIII